MAKMTDRELEELYESGDSRLSQERSDFLLPQIIDFVTTRKWINLHPEYQRRSVWEPKKRSLFIESFLINLPVPPVFLYEWDYNRYEVIDGQQRLSAIADFYSNRFKLSGLEQWTGLNGKKYSDLPPVIQRGLDRRRISAVVLLAENNAQRRYDIRRLMFERLNTGGQNLNHQELRNCLWSGPFNAMLIRLTQHELFGDVWDIPRYSDNVRGGHVSAELSGNSLYKRMLDCEIVLRFFTFRKRSSIRGAVKTMLDRCMEENQNSSDHVVASMEQDFISRLELAYEVFGADTFRLPPNEKGDRVLSRPLYDAVMVGLDRLFASRELIHANRSAIKSRLETRLEDKIFFELVVGRGNTADAIKDRLDAVEEVLKEGLNGATS